MEGIVLPNSPEKLIKTAVSTKASATPAENVPNGSSTNSSKSDAVAEQMTGRSASQNGKPGIHFPIGILKECEVQVQAFLEDADSVLAALDQCQAEEKCLMLIKRPKDSARKMLKSHSWANLSVSDPQLYRQFNGIQLAQVHHPGLTTFHKAKRSSDEQSVTSTDTDRSEPRRRYVSARGKENVKQPPHAVRALPDPGNQSSDYYLSDSSSVASDYQYVPRRERDRERDAGRRADLRYSSIPEDAQEINNNNSNKAAMYHSCHDVSLAAQAGGAGRPDWGRQGQGQGHQGQGHPGQGQGPIPSDKMYGSRGGPDCGGAPPATHDPGDMMEDGVRSQSLGNLSTGLTLSLVGQRKADSMLDLSSSTAPSSSSSSSARPQPQPQPQPHHYHPPPRTHAPRPRRSEAAGYLDDIFTSPDGCVRSPRHSYPEGVRSPRSREGSETFSPPPPHRDSNGYHNYNDVRSPPPHQQQYHHHSNHYQQQQQQQKHPNNYYHHPNYANAPVSGGQRGQQQHNGYAYASGGSGSTSGEQTPQSDGAPPKPKRSLPNVPLNETSERIKRFTEMMRSRMSVCSSADRSTTSSQTPTTPHTPLSRQASITENGSDCEVSTLLDVRLKNASEGNGGGGGGGRAPHPQQDARAKEGWGGEGRGKGGPHHPPYPARPPPPSSSQETPQPYGDPLGESGHTPFTSHSHSSTMDSGYTTNTEGDADSTTNTSHHQLSPPHHHSHQHQHHHPTAGQHPQQPQPLPHPNSHPHHHHHPGQQQSNPGHAAQPQQAGGAAATELPRPVPVPRNLSLASARKFSSMQNVSSVHGQQQPAYPSAPPPHPGEWGGAAARNPPGPQPRGPGPGPMRAQHSLNGADYPAAVAVVEHQRRSWDLAHNFKSLDFMPVADGAAQARGGPLAREDHVVKPQAVSVKAGCSSGSGTQGAERASPRRSDGQQRREGPESGQGKRGSWQEPRTSQNPAPPASSPPYPPPEANGINTLPGHWKYNNANNGNVVNNNNSSSTVNNAVVSNRNLHNTDAPKTHPKPNNDATTTTNTATTTTCTTAATTTTPSLTLFQLSQCYDLCSVKLTLPGTLSAGSTVTLSSLQVTLPALALDSASAPVHSPQGRCARLGGPGSAFRPVRTGAGAGGQTTVSLTGVESADKQCQELCTLGELRAGDVVVEVNGRHCLGWELTSVQHLLDNAQGEVMLGIARKKEEQIDNRVQQLESSLKKLEMEVQRLNEEMSKKDARILELSTMLPWKRDEETGGDKVILESEEGAFVIGDNEFVV